MPQSHTNCRYHTALNSPESAVEPVFDASQPATALNKSRPFSMSEIGSKPYEKKECEPDGPIDCPVVVVPSTPTPNPTEPNHTYPETTTSVQTSDEIDKELDRVIAHIDADQPLGGHRPVNRAGVYRSLTESWLRKHLPKYYAQGLGSPIACSAPRPTPMASAASKPVASSSSNSLPARWRDLNAAQKYLAAVRVPGAEAFTLNLSPEVERTARNHDDTVAYLTKRLNCALAVAGFSGTPYALALEISPTDRLHIHGVVVTRSVDPAALKRALMTAGGRLPGRSASRQAMLKELYHAEGWANYTSKDRRRTEKALPGKRLSFLSMPMLGAAKKQHEALLLIPKRRVRKSLKVSSASCPVRIELDGGSVVDLGDFSGAEL